MEIRPIIFTKKSALEAVGGLSDVSKMPGKSYGLPTAACHTGARLAKLPGSICAQCYAMKGHYRVFAYKVLPVQERRLASLASPAWVDAMVVALMDERWFRWFDSGDLQSIEHLDKIVQVARLTPHCSHWLATRERGFVRAYLKQAVLPDNLCLRLSATFPDRPARTLPGVQVSNVHWQNPPVGHECPAPKQGGHCDTCRACWDKSVQAVSYHKH